MEATHERTVPEPSHYSPDDHLRDAERGRLDRSAYDLWQSKGCRPEVEVPSKVDNPNAAMIQ